jgi:hypothetical protein
VSLLFWAVAVGALAGTGNAIVDHDRQTALSLIVVAAVFGVLAHVAKWRATR